MQKFQNILTMVVLVSLLGMKLLMVLMTKVDKEIQPGLCVTGGNQKRVKITTKEHNVSFGNMATILQNKLIYL